MGYYHENPAAASVPSADEAQGGKTRQATAQQIIDGVAGNLFATAARLKAELDRRLTSEAWHVVGAVGEPAFVNGWVNFGAPYETAGFYKDASGRVHLRGTVKSGANAAIFVLPAGYRPAADLPFSTASLNDVSARRIEVRSTGGVAQTHVGPAETSLNGISFRAA